MGKINLGMIERELGVIEKSNAWINGSLDGETRTRARRVITDCRRKLKREMFALGDNPAAALYGESQVGKSYLIGSLLSVGGNSFEVTDGSGGTYDFIKNINPPGGGKESTSVVSRFSVNREPVVKEGFPIKAALLSAADMVLVLCDGFYQNIKTSRDMVMPKDAVVSEINSLKERLKGRKASGKTVLDEDDIWDMQDYFNEYFSQKAGNVLDAGFFEEMAPLISVAEPSEWKDIFSLLWNRNEKISGLFETLAAAYKKLGFSSAVYLPMNSVLVKHGTLLDVTRLNEIFAGPGVVSGGYEPNTKVFLADTNQEVEIQKSYLCALAAELRFGLADTLLESKPFLKNIDLLDFPGARAHLNLSESEITDGDICQMFRRGKVAYLFNKYSNTKRISIFMLCAKHEQSTALSMPGMLNGWINKFIGDTPEKRRSFIKNSKVSPLFIIGTFFNVNLEYNPNQDRADNLSSLNYRWNQRFDTTLATEMLNAGTYAWFNNWTDTGDGFKNIFLLRDFVFSDSKIFSGFLKNKKETEEITPPEYPDLRQKLRQSFLEYPFVRNHFENPAESYDSAASINNDGTKLIIEKLTVAAENINIARTERCREELNEISSIAAAELKKHFHSDDKDETLQKAKNTAGKIQLKMATAFGGDGIKQFGPLMKELTLDESDVFRLYHKILDDIEHRNQRNMDRYSIIRTDVPPTEGEGADEYFERARAYYNQTEEEFRAHLEENQINLADLLSGNYIIKDEAGTLAEALLEHWLDRLKNAKLPIAWRVLADGNQTQNQQGPPALLMEIANMYRQLFEKLDAAGRIAEKITRYTNRSGRSDKPYKIISDMSAEYLNKFITTAGFEWLDNSALNSLRQANENVGKGGGTLGLRFDREAVPAKQSVEDLFAKIHNLAKIVNNNPKELESLPNYHNYLLWADRLKIGFVYACDIPTYDPEANRKLGDIIKERENIGRY